MDLIRWGAVAVFFVGVFAGIVTDRLILRRLEDRHAALFRELKSPTVDDLGWGMVSDAYRAYRRFLKSDRHTNLRDVRLSRFVVIWRRAGWLAYGALAALGLTFLVGGQA